MKLEKMFETWKKIFGNWRYLVIALLIAFAFYEINVLISSWGTLKSFYGSLGFLGTFKFLATLTLGFKETIKFHSFVSLIFISVMLGMLFSLVAYKVTLGNGFGEKRVGLFGGAGIFLAAFAPGCAACGVGLASVLGIGTAFLTFFPYEGLELSVLSIAILGFSILKTTNDMFVCKTPKISLNKMKASEKALNKSRSLTFTRLKAQSKTAHSSIFAKQKLMKGGNK